MAHENPHQQRAIRSELRGPHWIAWVDGRDGKPEQSVVLVGLTREEAEDRAKQWFDEQTRQTT